LRFTKAREGKVTVHRKTNKEYLKKSGKKLLSRSKRKGSYGGGISRATKSKGVSGAG